MKRALLAFLISFTFFGLRAQVQYEDFEGGVADVAWEGLNGTYNGPVANPDVSGLNTTEWVGSYTNDPAFDFCFALGTLAAPVDLSQFNLIKMKVWSPIAPTQVLFKFEGGGSAVEMFRPINVANQWVEVSFDLSGGASFTTMDKVLVSFNPFVLGNGDTFYFDEIEAVEPVQAYETFEGGAQLAWQALDGEFNGPVENPDSNSVNGSEWVGQYVKSGLHAYSLLLADAAEPFDMSLLNQFHLNIHAGAATQVLLKLEGAGGPAIERIKNIGLADEWQDYTFDFSEAKDWTHLNRVVLFFDPGVETSQDTYYFDNLWATTQGACANATLDPTIVDDFECNRNATYTNGWDSLHVADNPAPNTVNLSSKVGAYNDPLNEPWGALVMDFQNALDLSENNQLRAKIHSAKAVPVLFKLEGGSSPAKEVWANVETVGEWVQYEVDFSSEALASHKKIVIFFNAGVDAEAGDVYYIDDIQWAAPTSNVLEDFENGAFLPWAPLDDLNLLHGNFAVVANPDQSGVNTSASVGEYAKGTSAFSTLVSVAPSIIDITTQPQYNLDVWAPNGGTVIMQLESVSEGNKEVQRTVEQAASWQTLSFDFTDHQATTDWASIRLIFNPGVAEEGTVYYFDNLTQSERTVDPCEGTVAVPNLIDDFECQRNYETGVGATLLTVEANPLESTANSSTLVGAYAEAANDPWAALCYEFPEGIDLSSFNQLSVQILAGITMPVLMKLEGGSSGAVEKWVNTTVANEWETVTVDFAEQTGGDYRRVCFFFNGGENTPEAQTFYIDNVQFAHAPFDGCIMNFDDPAFTSDTWLFFPSDDAGEFELVENPDPSGINTSGSVGKAVEKASSGQPWQGMYTNLPAPIRFGTDKIVKMKVWAPAVATVTMKMEGPQNPNAPGSSGDNTVANTVANQWEELTFDFSLSPTPIPDDGDYARVTLIFDINNTPTEDRTWYFDDIQLTTGGCSAVGLFDNPGKLPELSIYPNPVTDELQVVELGQVSRLEVFNILGQRVASVEVGNASQTVFQTSNFQQGTYILNGYDAKGQLLAVSRFIKL